MYEKFPDDRDEGGKNSERWSSENDSDGKSTTKSRYDRKNRQHQRKRKKEKGNEQNLYWYQSKTILNSDCLKSET